MKNLLTFLLCLTLYSCDDGDLTIETIDFDDIDIDYCDTTVTTSSTLFFKINGNEALILTLASGTLKNEASEGEVEYPISTSTTLIYRDFSDDVSSDYFCNLIPTTEPTVMGEIEAESGSVLITTTEIVNGENFSYEHTIRLSEITLINESNNQRITDLSINDFGTVTTE